VASSSSIRDIGLGKPSQPPGNIILVILFYNS
jgi:hypothetical protein